jgi:hypothetical protein
VWLESEQSRASSGGPCLVAKCTFAGAEVHEKLSQNYVLGLIELCCISSEHKSLGIHYYPVGK